MNNQQDHKVKTKKTVLEVLDTRSGGDETVQTFILHDEDHTLGNALKYMLNKNPQVTFAGYSITHPSESKINLRIQTSGIPAVDALKQAFIDLRQCCSHILTTFESSTKYYKDNHMDDSEVEGQH